MGLKELGSCLREESLSVMDDYPDPLFKYGQARIGGRYDIERKWDPQGKVLCLPMYEHDTGPVSLIKQRKVEHTRGSIEGWDERWQPGETRPVDHRRRHRSWGLVWYGHRWIMSISRSFWSR